MVALAWVYLAGGIFLLANRRPFEEAGVLTYYQYWVWYGQNAAVQQWLLIAGAASLIVIGAPCAWLFAPAKRSLFGDARFASLRDVRKAGLLAGDGVVVGKFKGRWLTFGGTRHVLLSAPTRSGKGVGIVIPNLLTWPDSVVVLDIKTENWSLTSRYRAAHGQKVFLFAPGCYSSHRYNPLSFISADPNARVDDVQRIGAMLFPDVPGTDVIWTATPRSLFLGLVLLLMETPGKPVTLGQVLRESLIDGDGSKYLASVIHARSLGARIAASTDQQAIAQARSDVITVLADRGKAWELHPKINEMAVWADMSAPYRGEVARMLAERGGPSSVVPDLLAVLDRAAAERSAARMGTALSPTCVDALNTYLTIESDNTRSGIIGSFRSRLELWSNPLVDAATSASDFDLREVRRTRMSIYLGVDPPNLARMAPLLNLMLQQLVALNTATLPEHDRSLRHQCLILADEFTAPGKLDVLSSAISYIAGYGLRLLPVIQSPAQLRSTYGADAAENFAVNHGAHIVFAPKAVEAKLAREMSEWLGYQTVKGTSESRSKRWFSNRNPTESTSDQRRALLLPQEIVAIGDRRQILVVEDCPPIVADKIRYYEEPAFVQRLKEVSPSLRASRRSTLSRDQVERVMAAGELAAAVPAVDLQAHAQSYGPAAREPQLSAGPGASRTARVIVRAAVPADVPRLASLGPDSFCVDFSRVDRPSVETLDLPALHGYADRLCVEVGINL